MTPAASKQGDQLCFSVNAHVSVVGMVIVVGERPADALRQVSGHAHHQVSTPFQHPHHLGNGRVVVEDMFQDLGADHQIKDIVLEGQAIDIRRKGARLPAATFPELLDEAQPVSGLADVIESDVSPNGHNVSESGGGAHVTAGAAPHVQDPEARLYGQSIKIDGDHEWPLGKPRRSFQPPAST